MLRIGIIGFGKMGRTRATSVEGKEGVKVTKIFDVNTPRPGGYAVASSAQEIIDDRDVDAVFICLPNHLNKAMTIAALNAGKHVFCEKPPAFTAADVEEIRIAERASGKVLMYGFNHRHHEAVVKMREIIASGKHGKILWMRGRYGKSVDADYINTWRANREQAGGGILIDQGIHMLDLFLFLTRGSFDEVHALVSSRYWNIPGVEDNVFAIMRDSKSGVEASLHSTMTQWRHLFSLEVFLERGYMVLNGLKTSSNSYGEEELTVALNRSKAPAATWEDEQRFKYHTDTSWGREADVFLDAIFGRHAPDVGSSEQALQVMDIIDRIYRNQRRESAQLYTTLNGGDNESGTEGGLERVA